MARVTIEDCLEQISDCFELAVFAAHRARQLSSGATLTVPRNNDKDHVIALREIAEKTVLVEDLRQSHLRGFQRYIESEDTTEEFGDLYPENEKNEGDSLPSA